MNRRFPRFSILLAAFVLCVPLAACGGGGGGGSVGVGATLQITTTSVPGGTTASAYPTTQLETTGAEGPLTWNVIVGTTPTGVDLSPAGVLSGTPTANGTFVFTVEVDDTAATDTQDLTIVVSDLTLTVTSGLNFGDAWAGAPLSLATLGVVGTISFSTLTNASGGSFSNENGAAGTATWTPGSTAGVTDTLRATDTTSSETFDLDIDVEMNPVINHVAGFGSQDVWWLETSVKRGSHAYATDMHAQLVDLGLWPAASTGPATTELELLVELLIEVQIRRELSLIYLRNADGSQGTGLAISFPYDEPASGTYTAPSPTNTLNGSSTRYSIMEIADAGNQPNGVLGVAILDTGGNDDHEHDGGSSLGVLIDRISDFFEQVQSSRLIANDPVANADIDILKALIYGTSMSGTRYNEIRTLVLYFSRAVANVTAHEIGHSLGIDHNSSPGTLMAASISFGTSQLSTSNAVPLTSSEITTLQGDLPGPGRSIAPLLIFGTELPEDAGAVRMLTTATGD